MSTVFHISQLIPNLATQTFIYTSVERTQIANIFSFSAQPKIMQVI